MTDEAVADREFEGLRVLVIEDEGPVAMLVEVMLEDLGCVVVDSAARVGEALDAIERGGFEFALLDMNLAGQRVDPVAEALCRRGTPFAFASGYGEAGAPPNMRDRPMLQKPFGAAELAQTIRRALSADVAAKDPGCSD